MAVYTASGNLLTGPFTVAGAALFTVPVYTATGALVMPAFTVSGIAHQDPCQPRTRIANYGGQELMGLTEQFKVNPGFRVVRIRHRSPVLHLTRAKPCMNTVTGIFGSVYSGTHFASGQFHYVHPSKIWEFTNLTDVSGLLPDESDSAGIPIMPISHVQGDTVFSSFVGSLQYES